MGIHVPQTLLNVSEKITVKVNVKDLTDRQLKNIARQVRQGHVSRWSNSATSIITRHVLHELGIPHIRYNSWGIATHHIPNDHPLWEAVVNAVAITKIEDAEKVAWHSGELERDLQLASSKAKPSITRLSVYRYSDTGRNMLEDAIKSYKPKLVPTHAEEFLNKLLNRDIETIELDVERGDGSL